MTDFGVRLKKAMDDKRMNASELSRLSGVGKNLISYYVNGKYLAKQDKVYLLAKALDVDPGWLITGVEPEKDVIERSIPIVVPNSEKFVKLTQYMPEEDFQMVMHAFERAEERMREAEGETE
jgi:transcriptional regulator with XRE-family HTH domain